MRSLRLIFHLAANIHADELDHTANDIGTQNLVRSLEPLGPESHLVFASSVAESDNPSAPLFPQPRVPWKLRGRRVHILAPK